MNPRVAIIVLNWNGRSFLKDCLDSLLLLDYPNYKIIVVDNASLDGSPEFIESHFPDICLIRNKKNYGFAEGNNIGIRFALAHGADYVVLLNNDTQVEADFLTYLIQRGEEDKEIGILGGKVLMFFAPHIVNSTGINLNKIAFGWDRDFGEDTFLLKREQGEVLAVTGCLMAIKKEVFDKIGLLDPKYFAYYEDVDFCIRLWKYTSYRVEYVPESVIYHKFSSSFTGESYSKKYLMLKNQYRIFFRHFPVMDIVKALPILIYYRVKRIPEYLRKKDFKFFLIEILMVLKHIILFPFLLFSRACDAFRKDFGHERFWRKVLQDKKPPDIKPIWSDYAQLVLSKKQIDKNDLPHRILMGVNDEILGRGWSPLILDYPRVRKIKVYSLCFLKNKNIFEFVQIHGLWLNHTHHPSLEIKIEKEVIGTQKIKTGWNTYIFPFKNIFKEGPIELELRITPLENSTKSDDEFAINEIGLFSLGSPFLRWFEGS